MDKGKILLTGATGFIGRHLILDLVDKYDVTALVRKTSDTSGIPKGVKFVYGDLSSLEFMPDLFENFDTVIHLAALMSDKDFYPYREFHKVNVDGTLNLIKLLRGKFKDFIYISTVGIFGATSGKGAGEDAPYGKALSKYEKSKAAAEKALLAYCYENKINLTILRIGQLYGPGMKYGWPQVLKNIENGKMFCLGKGDKCLHLTHVHDAVKGIILSIGNDNARNQTFNVCAETAHSIKSIFAEMAACLNKPAPKPLPFLPVYLLTSLISILPRKIKPKSLQYLDMHRLNFFNSHHVYKIEKAQKLLGYRPDWDLKKGIADLVNWYKREDGGDNE